MAKIGYSEVLCLTAPNYPQSIPVLRLGIKEMDSFTIQAQDSQELLEIITNNFSALRINDTIASKIKNINPTNEVSFHIEHYYNEKTTIEEVLYKAHKDPDINFSIIFNQLKHDKNFLIQVLFSNYNYHRFIKEKNLNSNAELFFEIYDNIKNTKRNYCLEESEIDLIYRSLYQSKAKSNIVKNYRSQRQRMVDAWKYIETNYPEKIFTANPKQLILKKEVS